MAGETNNLIRALRYSARWYCAKERKETAVKPSKEPRYWQLMLNAADMLDAMQNKIERLELALRFERVGRKEADGN